MDKVLLAGPWVGEFGYELCQWQGFIRKMSRDYDKTIVASRPGHEVLYSDFCSEYIPYEINIEDCNKWKSDVKYDGSIFDGVDFSKHVKPQKMEGKQEYFKYGTFSEYCRYDLVIHARDFKNVKGRRNWPVEKWSEFIRKFRDKYGDLKVCSIGISSSSACVETTDDNRDLPLSEVVDILHSSKLTIGPSSGPMHLASLCGCPHLVWAEYNLVYERYAKSWNPFNTKAILHPKEGCNPSVNSILNLIDMNNLIEV